MGRRGRRGSALALLAACVVCHGWVWTPPQRLATRLPPSRFARRADRRESEFENSEFRRDHSNNSSRAMGELSGAAIDSTYADDDWAFDGDSLNREQWEVPNDLRLLAGAERLRDRPTDP